MAGVRYVVTFDVPEGPIGPYDAEDGLSRLRRTTGVQGVTLYESREGHPDYLLDVQVDSGNAEGVRQTLEQLTGEYSMYLSNVTRRQFRMLA
ncbi:MAG: hypothetical protein M1298_05785 [Chloroflexi bacterium]|nr:hypothetical protein [Chloroflexota bacterium]